MGRPNSAVGSHINPLLPGRKYIVPVYEVGEYGLEQTAEYLDITFVGKEYKGITVSQLLNCIKHKLIFEYNGYNATEEQQDIIDTLTDIVTMIREEKENRD